MLGLVLLLRLADVNETCLHNLLTLSNLLVKSNCVRDAMPADEQQQHGTHTQDKIYNLLLLHVVFCFLFRIFALQK